MRNFAIGKRLYGAFSLVLILFALAVFYVGAKTSDVHDRAATVEQGVNRAEAAASLLREVMSFRITVRNMLLKKDAAGVASEGDNLSKAIRAIRKDVEPFVNAPEPEVKEAAGIIAKNADILIGSTEDTVRIAKGGDLEGAFASMAKGTPLAAGLQENADKLIKAVQAQSRQEIGLLKDDAGAGLRSLIMVFVLAMLASIACAWWVTRSITRPIAGMVVIAEQLATGDFSRQIQVDAQDEIGSLQQAFRKMTESLNRAMGEVSQGASRVESAARHLETNSRTVQGSISTQSESAAAMAAALEQMSTSVDHISDISQGARTASTVASTKANDGARGIHAMIGQIDSAAQSMRDSASKAEALGHESARISSIVSVIKEVADQTNLLALNAAIEAARAGEQGRGFAVVADEVRKLAEKTTNSTQEISDMVAAIQSGTTDMTGRLKAAVSAVDEGLGMAREAGSLVNEIDADAQSVLHVIDEVSLALREQAAASREISARVETVVQMVEENAAAASSMSAASHDMNELAGVLQAGVSRFRLAR